jgi:hypothetical protein
MIFNISHHPFIHLSSSIRYKSFHQRNDENLFFAPRNLSSAKINKKKLNPGLKKFYVYKVLTESMDGWMNCSV